MESFFESSFGFTEEEVKKILSDFEIEEEIEDVKRWYDGYKIGDREDIYNPWSILKFVKHKKLDAYWVNTSQNSIIKKILKNSKKVKEELQKLIQGEEIEVYLKLDLVYKEIEKEEENIWGLFVNAGYLKVVGMTKDRKYILKIPNYEIRELFFEIINSWFSETKSLVSVNSLLNDLLELKVEEYRKKFKKITKEMFSYFDVGRNTAENFYHAFVLGMLVNLKDEYYIRSNRESGDGRYDIMLEPIDKSKNAYIMEFKVYEEDEEKDITETLQNARKQVEKMKYDVELKSRGINDIYKIVYAFSSKNVELEIY